MSIEDNWMVSRYLVQIDRDCARHKPVSYVHVRSTPRTLRMDTSHRIDLFDVRSLTISQHSSGVGTGKWETKMNFIGYWLNNEHDHWCKKYLVRVLGKSIPTTTCVVDDQLTEASWICWILGWADADNFFLVFYVVSVAFGPRLREG